LFFLSIFFAPWYINIFFAIALTIVSSGYEIIIGGLIIDLIYGASVPEFFTSPFSFTIFFGILYFCSYFIKKQLIFYQS
jgi:hypothetical protein